ncbi:MAG TPA: S8 family peptidase [Sphingobium sp.]
MRGRSAHFFAIFAMLPLAACGGGSSGGSVQSTPPPISAPTPTPTPPPVSTPAGANVDYDTAEYRASSGPSFHGAITAYEAGASGAGVTIGIVDSGISDIGGEFTGRISPLSRDFGGNGSITDIGGHGTAVAETLAGARNDNHVQGMAWGATILALRTDKPGSCTSSGGCVHNSSAMTEAIDYAWKNGARVINISLGGDINSADLLAAVSRATSAGSIVVVAAGNGGSAGPDLLATTMANPKYGHGLVVIAASVGNDGRASSFSNGAAGFEGSTLSALGDAVRTMDNRGADLLYTGTSFSAPQISGAAALLAQAFPGMTSAQIVQLLLNTAKDAGAAGPDSVYGMGILDVAAAFRPQGTLSLAGSAASLSASAPTLLSGAMGDASPTGLATVILDGYRRPFRMDLAARMERPGLRSRLTAALAGTTRQIQGMAGPLSLSLNLAPGQGGSWMPAYAEAARTRFLSGTMGTRLAGGAVVAFGLRTGFNGLAATLEGRAKPAFMIAEDGAGALAPELRAGSSFGWRQALAPGLNLTSGMEIGSIDAAERRPGAPLDPVSGRAARYQAFNAALTFSRGAFRLTGGLGLLNETGSALGARFAPALGAQSARTTFASLAISVQPAARLLVSASVRRGWTQAAAGGALVDGGFIRSRSWSLDLARSGLFAKGDFLGLRVSAPLRVTASRFLLDLPQSWDWKSQTATTALTPLDLVPRGSERDYELSYGLGLSGGWLGANLFARTQAGNVAAMRDDYGAALRWTSRF